MLQLQDQTPLQRLQAAELTYPNITGDQVLEIISHQGEMARWIAQVERSHLIKEICKTLEIEVSEAELQAAGDAFRRTHGLESATKTQAWLAQRQMSLEDWATGIHDQLLTEKLQVFLFGNSVDQHYLDNRHDYDRVALSQILVKEETLAQNLRHQLDQDANCFCQLALDHSIHDDREKNGGFVGIRYLKTLQPDCAAAIRNSQAGAILGPFQTNNGYSLLKIEKIYPTQLTLHLREAILQDLFEQWLMNLKPGSGLSISSNFHY